MAQLVESYSYIKNQLLLLGDVLLMNASWKFIGKRESFTSLFKLSKSVVPADNGKWVQIISFLFVKVFTWSRKWREIDAVDGGKLFFDFSL
jgi:hypothetical protein